MKLIYTIIIYFVFAANNLFAAFWEEKVIDELKGSKYNLYWVVQEYMAFILGFLYIIATIYGIYWWYQIFTAWDDDEKVKKWKTIIIQACIWIVVIFLAGPIAWFMFWWSGNPWLLNQ